MPSRITLNANGGPEVLRLEQVQAQQPGPGEVWLEQTAIGVNPLDLGQRSGAVPILLPSGLGLEGAGVVAELTAGRKVDVVYDPIGRATFEASLNSLRPRGLLVSFGATSGVPPAVEVATLNAKGSLFLTRPSLAAHTANPEEYRLRAQAVLRAHADGVIQPRVWRRYPLAEAAVAHTDLLEGRSQGALVLLP
ncbi:TPA: zinc-binding dehydrogenase [Pseudomonas aeruginosa]